MKCSIIFTQRDFKVDVVGDNRIGSQREGGCRTVVIIKFLDEV